MPSGLIRYEHTGSFHFLTFSCYHRFQYLGGADAGDLFEDALERVRQRYRFVVAGYIVMPEHVHLLIGEPVKSTVSGVIHALKLSVAMRRGERPFWQARYYDFLVHNKEKRVEKLRYMHRNPVVRGLVAKPEEWAWSSFQHYATGVAGRVEIESQWTAMRRATSCLNICVTGKRQVEVFAIPGAQQRGTWGTHRVLRPNRRTGGPGR
jgi:putative transposase